jgi:hypothetical protein
MCMWLTRSAHGGIRCKGLRGKWGILAIVRAILRQAPAACAGTNRDSAGQFLAGLCAQEIDQAGRELFHVIRHGSKQLGSLRSESRWRLRQCGRSRAWLRLRLPGLGTSGRLGGQRLRPGNRVRLRRLVCLQLHILQRLWLPSRLWLRVGCWLRLQLCCRLRLPWAATWLRIGRLVPLALRKGVSCIGVRQVPPHLQVSRERRERARLPGSGHRSTVIKQSAPT